MKYSKFYNKVADLVEKGWTQGTSARTKSGARCDFQDTRAVSWCLSGAILAVYYGPLSVTSLTELRSYLGIGALASRWNDHPDRTQEEVLKLLRETAKRADEENKIIGEQNDKD